MSARPFMKWYPSDWRGDSRLRSCDPIARYVWLEMIGLMHESEPYGHLCSGGKAMDLKILAQIIAVDEKPVRSAVRLLEKTGVLSRTNEGVIYSRRMVRDEYQSKVGKINGKKGGNPTLAPLIELKIKPLQNQQLIDRGLTPPVKLGLTHPVNTHIPETRNQNITNQPWSTGPEEVGRGLVGLDLVLAEDQPQSVSRLAKPHVENPENPTLSKAIARINEAFKLSGIAGKIDTTIVAAWQAKGVDLSMVCDVICSGIIRKPDVKSLAYFAKEIDRKHLENQFLKPSEAEKKDLSDRLVVFVERDSDAWKAWLNHRGVRGFPQSTQIINGFKKNGWNFPSLYPPSDSVITGA